MRKLSVEQAHRYIPLAVAYMLGVLTFWGGFAVFGGPDTVQPLSAERTGGETTRLATVTFRDIDDDDLPSHVEPDTESSREKLRTAAKSGDAATVRQLIGLNADVNAPDDQGRTALFLAAAAGETDIVRSLIDAGADTDAATLDGQTPLMAAAIKGNSDTIMLLLRHDANVRMKSGEGVTAHDLAIRHKHDSVARLIADEIDRQNRERMMVTRAQFLLAKLGYRPGGIDGYLGPRTRLAIQRFQKKNDMNPDGRVTEDLIGALGREQKIVTARKAKPPAKKRAQTAKRADDASKRAFHRASMTQNAPTRDEWKTSGGAKKENEGGLFGWLNRTFGGDSASSSDGG